jgi:simple sugar transport system permease protein
MSATTKKEPLFRLVKRDDISPRQAWVYRAIAFVLALLTGGLLILVLGQNPLFVYRDMVIGAW